MTGYCDAHQSSDTNQIGTALRQNSTYLLPSVSVINKITEFIANQ